MRLRDLLRRAAGQTMSVSRPEDYWPTLGAKVVGNLSRADMLKGHQADTYRAVCDIVSAHRFERLVDLGCNVGMLGVFLRESGYRGAYVGADANPNALAVATANLDSYRLPATFLQANLRQIPFRERSVPNVVLKDVLEHMEDFRPILAEVLRVAGPYALIVNFIPWTEGMTIIRREPAGYYHNAYARRDVYAFIKEHGFEVASVTASLEADARPNEIIVLRRLA